MLIVAPSHSWYNQWRQFIYKQVHFFLYSTQPHYSAHSHNIPTLSDSGIEHAILSLYFYPPSLFSPPHSEPEDMWCIYLCSLAVVGWKWMFPAAAAAAAAFVSLTGSRTRKGGFYCHIRYNAEPLMNCCTLCGEMGWTTLTEERESNSILVIPYDST